MPADYVLARQRIRAALDKNETLLVYATDPVLLGWLGDLQRYPESRVTWRVLIPAKSLPSYSG